MKYAGETYNRVAPPQIYISIFEQFWIDLDMLQGKRKKPELVEDPEFEETD